MQGTVRAKFQCSTVTKQRQAIYVDNSRVLLKRHGIT